MSASSLTHPGPVMDINDPKVLFTAMFMVVIGMEVFIVQPGFVQGLVEHAGFSDKQAGYIASAEMFGIAFATVLMTVVASRINWRTLCIGSLTVVVIGNLLSAAVNGFEIFSAIRFVTGIGSGILISLGYAIVGLSSDPDRGFGFMIVLVLTYSALVLLLMPFAYSVIGVPGMLMFFGLLALCGLPFVRRLPASGEEHTVSADDVESLSWSFKFMALGAVSCYFLAQGVVWAYLFLIGTAAGNTEQQIAIGLTVSQFFGIGGAFTAAILGARYGRVTPLTLGTLGGVVPLIFLLGAMGAIVYAVAVSVFNYAANLMTPLLLAIIAGFDRSGRLVVYAVALQMLGFAIGPALAASVIRVGDYSNINWLSMCLFSACLVLILPPVVKSGLFAEGTFK